MTSGHLEIETKYDVDGGFARPDLTGLPGVATVDEPVEHLLEAVYLDTADLRLLRARITLRRRTGGAGRRLAPQAAGGNAPAVSCTPRWAGRPRTRPAPCCEPVTGILRGATARPVATLRTRRLVTALRDADGQRARRGRRRHGDRDSASRGRTAPRRSPRGARSRSSSVDGDEALAAAVGERLVAAGARPSASASKIGRVLAGRLASVPAPTDGTEERPDGGGVRARRAPAEQVAGLQAADVMVCAPSSRTPSTRCACPRGGCAAPWPPSGPSWTGRRPTPLRDELSWLGGELADVRDDEVALAHLRELVAAEPAELVLGPVAARLQQAEIRDCPGRAGPGAAHAVGAAVPPAAGRPVRAARRPAVRRRARGRRSAPVLDDALRRSARRLRRRLTAPRAGRPRPTARSHCTTSARRPSGSGTPPRPAAARSSHVKKLVKAAKKVQTDARRGAGHRRHPRVQPSARRSPRPPRGRAPSPTAGCTPSSRPAPSGPREKFWALEPKIRPTLKAAACR